MMSLARELASQPDREHILERVIEAVKELVPHADDVGITLVRRRGGIATPAANGPVPRRSDALHAFDADDRDQVEAIAAHAASAVVAAGEIDNRQSALATRTVAAQAPGLLMSHYNVSSVVAFHLLERLPSEQNRKLSTIATDLIQDHDAAALAEQRAATPHLQAGQAVTTAPLRAVSHATAG